MPRLERLSKSHDAAWYAVRSGPEPGHDPKDAPQRLEPLDRVERYVVTTAPGRRVVNESDLVGVAFNLALESAATIALATAPFRDFLAGTPQDRVCVAHILRGGLNFELRRALHGAYGFNRHASAFLSSQRQETGGQWSVHEDAYRKLDIPNDAVLLIGDVVATGVTLEHGFETFIDHMAAGGATLRGLVLFTIGGPRAEAVLARVDARARAAFPNYERTIVVYLEARFHLVDEHSPLRIGLPGTDLVRRDALLTPELALSQHESLVWTLERCAIYDAGSRAFDVPTYLADVREYWEQLLALARGGLTLADAVDERWPVAGLDSRAAFAAQAERWWSALDVAEVDALYEAHQRRWHGPDGVAASPAGALVALCEARIASLDTLLGSPATP